MFAYSLSGLQIDENAAGGVTEVEENEITARSAVYQVLGQIFTPPDTEQFEKARDGQWVKELVEGAELLAFDWEIGEASLGDDVEKGAFVAEFERLFLPESGGVRRIWGGAYIDDRDQNLTELARAYEYYGLGTRDDSDVPIDHLTAELDFMQFLTFKEAAAASPRLGKSFRRAQQDFLERQLGAWVPAMAAEVRAADPHPFWGWALERLESFVAADAAWASA